MNTFINMFERVAVKYPNTIAIEDCGKSITYDQLRQKSLAYGCKLQKQGVLKGDLVILRMEKSIDYIASFIACWYVGAVFSPLDPKLPEKRSFYIIADSGAKYLIGDFSDISSSIIHLELSEGEGALRTFDLKPEDSAYIIYTSGSTGKPKGVDVSHAGLVPMLMDQIVAFGLKHGSKSLFMLSISFDASLSDIGTALLSGATLVIEPPCYLQAFRLLETIEACQINYIDMPPSILTQLKTEEKPECLQTIVIGGEVCPDKTIRRWAPLVNLINVYGPTEATICTSLVKCTKKWDRALIGKELSGVIYKISEEEELLISGPCLARGYINLPELTEQKFIFKDGRRWYRTGDRVELLDNGEYLFKGRLDHQVKLRGKLIELGEVVATINELERVNDSYVTKYICQGSERLVACIEAEDSLLNIVREHLKSRLPLWMLPSQIVFTKTLPRNNSNKLDVKALDELIEVNSWTGNESLEDLFFTYTGEAFSEDSNFLDVGIDSFGLMEISMAALDKGITLSPSLIAESQNLKELKSRLNTGELNSAIAASILREAANDELHTIAFPDLPSYSNGPIKGILLTGVTGFLGGEVLQELLSVTSVTIYCLVRCGTKHEGRNRILQANPALSEVINRIKVVPGNLVDDNFGLTAERYSELLHTVDIVYHCAADVNSLKSYDQLYPANVKGVVEVLKFCVAGRPKKLNYASTLSVFVSSDKNTGVLQEEDDLSAINWLYGGYSQSKFCAEIFLQKAQQLYPNINIFRFGLITPAQEKISKNPVDFLQMFIHETLETSCRPLDLQQDIEVDITPVDFASKAFVEIGQQSLGAPHAWHIANEDALNLETLYDEIEKSVVLEKLNFTDWTQKVKDSNTRGASLLSLCRLREDFDNFRTMDLFQASGVTFDMKKSKALLAKKGIGIPKISSSLIQKYIRGVQRL